MALSATVLANLIQTNLQNVGANGSNLSVFCNAVAAGIVLSIVGQTFNTLDVGFVTNPGTGNGIGITGLSDTAMSSMAINAMPSHGDNAMALMNSIMEATVSHLSSAAVLSSTDTLVYSGTGNIILGTFSITLAVMKDNIMNQLLSVGANGSNLSVLCNAIATGIVNEILSTGTGMVTITGVPPAFTVPGTNIGVGSIS